MQGRLVTSRLEDTWNWTWTGWTAPLDTGKAAAFLEVTRAERFWIYTCPATPAVLAGAEAGEGWRRFHLDVGHVRNWYFFVPKGTREFPVRAAAADETDMLYLELNAPDRTLAMLYDNKGERTVRVPAGRPEGDRPVAQHAPRRVAGL